MLLVVFALIIVLFVVTTFNVLLFPTLRETFHGATSEGGDAPPPPAKMSVDSQPAYDEFCSFYSYMRSVSSTSLASTAAITNAFATLPPPDNTPLKHLFVFGTFNSACTGTQVSVAAVNELLTNYNVRYLDLEIFPETYLSRTNIPVVGCSCGGGNTNQTNFILLDDMCISLHKIMSSLLSANYVFVQLRIRGSETADIDKYFIQIRNSFQTYLGDFLLTQQSNGMSAGSGSGSSVATSVAADMPLLFSSSGAKKIFVVVDKDACPALLLQNQSYNQYIAAIANMYTYTSATASESVAGLILGASAQGQQQHGTTNPNLVNLVYPAYTPSLLSTTNQVVQPDVLISASNGCIPLMDYSTWSIDSPEESTKRGMQMELFRACTYMTTQAATDKYHLMRSSMN